MVEYWEAVRGLKKGTKPNPTTLLYGAYLRWHKATGHEAPARPSEFQAYLVKRGYRKGTHGTKHITCWYLNKYIVPKSASSSP